MKQNLSLWQFGGFAVTALCGVLLHFLYDWSGQSIFFAPFSGINESTWEHMKLIYYPMLIFALVQSRYFKNYKNFWCIKLAGILTGLTLIPIIFYTYNGVFGKSPDWVNISIFFISAISAFVLECRLFKENTFSCKRPYIPFYIICFIGVLFVVFTFAPPDIPLFQDPNLIKA